MHKWTSILGKADATSSSKSESADSKKRRSIKIKLKKNKDSYFILLSLDMINCHNLQEKKQLIGKAVSNAYSSWAANFAANTVT